MHHEQLFGIKPSRLIRKVNGIEASAAGNTTTQANTTISQEEALERVKKDKRRLLHVVYRVGDLGKIIKFYTECLGIKLLRKCGISEEGYTNAFLGYGPEDKNAVLELTYNYGVKEYDKGNVYAQIAMGTDDVYKTAEAIKLYGGIITREPGPLPGINTKITACLDPDGWKIVFVDNIDFAKELE